MVTLNPKKSEVYSMVYGQHAIPDGLVNKVLRTGKPVKFRDPVLERYRILECNGFAIVDGDVENAMTYDTFIYIWFYDSERK